MRKKTALIGGFLLLTLASGLSAAGWLAYQAHQFQNTFQQWASGSGYDAGHLRLGLGDLDQSSTFPVASGRFRVSAYNRCTGQAVDFGAVQYSMGQVPGVYDDGEFQWFAPNAGDGPALFEFALKREAAAVVATLKPLQWLSAIAMDPALRIEVSEHSIQTQLSVSTLKLAAISKQPDDLLVRGLQAQMEWVPASWADSRLQLEAAQLGQGRTNVQNLRVDLTGEPLDALQSQWQLEMDTGPLMMGDFLLPQSKTQSTLFLGDTPAVGEILKSAVQSCGGFATTASHEFSVRAALNSLITQGAHLHTEFNSEFNGEPLLWKNRIQATPQIDQTTGHVHLGRALELENTLKVPFHKMGRKQQKEAQKTGFFTANETQSAYEASTQRNALMTQRTWSVLGKQASPKDNLASTWAVWLAQSLANTEQALYLAEFSLAQTESKVPRIDFEGLEGVRIDAQGAVRKLLVVP